MENIDSIFKNLEPIVAPSPEDIEKERYDRFNIDKFEKPVFAACSLGDWISLIENNKIDIPYVPVKTVFEESVFNLMSFETMEPEQWSKIQEKLDEMNKDIIQDSGSMLRWDLCSSSDIKHHMGNQSNSYQDHSLDNIAPQEKTLQVYDPRFFDMVYTFPYKKVKAFKRPIVALAIKDNYPVEFRVYVENGRVLGVSNYYPQISLDFNDFYLGLAQKACSHTEKLIKACQDSNCYPVMANAPREITFTADFIVSRKGNDVVFLEAGPGFGYGAHPCCFYDPRNSDEPILIQGIALNNDHTKPTSVVWQDVFETKNP